MPKCVTASGKKILFYYKIKRKLWFQEIISRIEKTAKPPFIFLKNQNFSGNISSNFLLFDGGSRNNKFLS